MIVEFKPRPTQNIPEVFLEIIRVDDQLQELLALDTVPFQIWKDTRAYRRSLSNDASRIVRRPQSGRPNQMR